MIKTNSEEYISGIESEISRLREKGLRYLLRPADELHPDVLNALVAYMKETTYVFRYNKCARCTNQYEIIIEFKPLTST